MGQNGEDHELVSIHNCEDDGEAEIIIDFLETNDIKAIVDSNVPHSVLPVVSDAHIMVNHADEAEARRLLEEREKAAEEEGGEAE